MANGVGEQICAPISICLCSRCAAEGGGHGRRPRRMIDDISLVTALGAPTGLAGAAQTRANRHFRRICSSPPTGLELARAELSVRGWPG